MEEIYKNSILLIHSITQLSGVCYQYQERPDDEIGEKLIETVDKCEKKLLKVKEGIVKMVHDVDQKAQSIESESEEIPAVSTDGGFLIN